MENIALPATLAVFTATFAYITINNYKNDNRRDATFVFVLTIISAIATGLAGVFN